MLGRVGGVCLLTALLGVSACKSIRTVEPLEPESETTLIVTRSGDAASLSWTAHAGSFYTVLYSNQLGGKAKWQILPGASNLAGLEGSTLTVNDRIGADIKRYYRLHVAREQVR